MDTDGVYIWLTFNFTGTKPTLTASTNYYIVAWSEIQPANMALGYQNTIGTYNIHYNDSTYNFFPASISAIYFAYSFYAVLLLSYPPSYILNNINIINLTLKTPTTWAKTA